MTDLQFTDWICTRPERHWVKRMISANGTIDMFTWVALHEDNLIYYHVDYENMTDDEIEEKLNKVDNQVWIVLFGDKLEKFQDLYEEMYGNSHKVANMTSKEILSNIDSFLERIVVLNIFT